MNPDIVVVGAGIVGCSIAYELAKDGASVVVVDRGEIGREASWAAGGILTPMHLADYPAPLADLCVRAADMYPGFIEEIQPSEDVEYQVTGMVYLVRDEQDRAEADKLLRWKREHNHAAEETEDGVFVPDVALVRNNRLTRAIAAAAQSKGVDFRTGTEVNGYLKVPGRINGVKTSRGDLRAETTVIASGAWAGPGVRPVKGQMLLARTEPEAIPHFLLQKEEYVVPRADGHVLIGSTTEEAGFDKSVTVSAAQFLLRRAVEMAPVLERAELLDHWAGLRPATPDRIPLIGPASGLEGLILAAGHFRNGILLGPITGRLVRDLIRGVAPEWIAAFRPDRPSAQAATGE